MLLLRPSGDPPLCMPIPVKGIIDEREFEDTGGDERPLECLAAARDFLDKGAGSMCMHDWIKRRADVRIGFAALAHFSQALPPVIAAIRQSERVDDFVEDDGIDQRTVPPFFVYAR